MLTIWQVLGIGPTRDKEIIQKAYDRIISQINLEDSSLDYKIVYLAYQEAMQYAMTDDRKSENIEEQESVIRNTEQEERTVQEENRKDEEEYSQVLFSELKTVEMEEPAEEKHFFVRDEREPLRNEKHLSFSTEEINDKAFWKQRFSSVEPDFSDAYEDVLDYVWFIENKGVLRFLHLMSFAKKQESHKQMQTRQLVEERFATLFPETENENRFHSLFENRVIKIFLGVAFFLGLCLLVTRENMLWMPVLLLLLTDAMGVVQDIKKCQFYLHDEWTKYYQLEKWNHLYILLVGMISFVLIIGYSFIPYAVIIALFLVVSISRLLLLKRNISYKLSIDYNVEYIYWFPPILIPFLLLFLLISPLFFLGDLSSTRFVVNEVAASLLLFSGYVLVNHYSIPPSYWKIFPSFLFVKIAGQLLFRLQFFYFLVLFFTPIGQYEEVWRILLLLFCIQIIFRLVNAIQIRKIKKSVANFPKGNFVNFLYFSFFKKGGNQ